MKKLLATIISLILAVTLTTPVLADTTKTLHAKWAPINYTITYNLGDGLATNTTSYNIATSTFTITNPTRESNYLFTGWTGSNGSTPQTTVTIPKGSTGNKTYTANWVDILEADSYIQKQNILDFINTNKNTTKQICFQNDGSDNKWYVKAGTFGTGHDAGDPNIIDSGTLIYCYPNNSITAEEGYKYLTHLTNIMNYIIYNTKGYGASSPIFTEQWDNCYYDNYYSSSKNEQIISKGFCIVAYDGEDFRYSTLKGRGETGAAYGSSYLYGGGGNALWW